MRFDRVAVVDWSAAAGRNLGPDSIWIGQIAAGDARASSVNLPTRSEALEWLSSFIDNALKTDETALIAVDLAFGYPLGFAERLTDSGNALSVWAWLEKNVRDDDRNRSNHRAVAAGINALFPGDGPFWGNGEKTDYPGLGRRMSKLPHGLAEFRHADEAARRGKAQPKSVWQLAGAGVVGAQVLTGLPYLQRLRSRFSDKIAVWPFEAAKDAQIVFAEVYPAMIDPEVSRRMAPLIEEQRHLGRSKAEIKRRVVRDDFQVRVLCEAIMHLTETGELKQLLEDLPTNPHIIAAEGWILGATAPEALLRAAEERQTAALPRLHPPRLSNDCFALPPGVDWTPVDDALALLRARLTPVVGREMVPAAQAAGRVLAEAAVARRSNPPAANAAVDGYGFAHAATGDGPQELPLLAGRAAAGAPFRGAVPQGAALRILTGAILPEGVDTVVLEEDTTTDGTRIAFHGPIKRGANTRRAGEDVAAGQTALPAGQVLRAPDLALLSALGVGTVPVFARLRVGVLSTGNEIEPEVTPLPLPDHRIFDANRPMLLTLARGWGFEAVDLGHVGDDRATLRVRLDAGAAQADVILTSGGASAGDEDHVSALLRESGAMESWRIAVKPGRPLALGLWRGVPVFGLPGNPVAALVCTLIFARPACLALAGAGWAEPQGLAVPAAFEKRKKPGRREYLRARLDARGHAEVFGSEGSGRISGLSWATGLVELPDGAVHVRPGDPVRYLSYAGFGLQ